MRWTAMPVLLILSVVLLTAHGFMQIAKFSGQQASAAAVRAQTRQEKKQVVVTAVGDCTVGSDITFGYEGTLPAVIDANQGDYTYIFRGVKPVTAADNLTIANLEGTFTNSNVRYPKQFAFKGPPEYAKILRLGSIEAVNLANNHTYDYYEQGYLDTIKALEAEGIVWFGENQPKVYQTGGVSIGLLGYAFEAADEQLSKDIAALRKQADIVIASFHWGVELSYRPDAYQRHLAHLAIDSGADLVIGHHPHVLQGLEVYKQRLIAYSLGNFAFGGNTNPSDKRTMLLQTKFTVRDKQVILAAVKIIPARISSVEWVNDYQPTILQGKERQEFIAWFADLCYFDLPDQGEFTLAPGQNRADNSAKQRR